jgi:uncharacterized protein YndB with AHSA1/START domain
MVSIVEQTLVSNSISSSVVIEAPIEEVWRALTTPEIIKQWFFGVDTETDWSPGSQIVHRGTHEGRAYQDRGEILEVEAPVLLVHTHWSPLSGAPDTPGSYQRVRYELRQVGTVTHLTVSETNLPSAEAAAASAESWDAVLKDLKYLLEKE